MSAGDGRWRNARIHSREASNLRFRPSTFYFTACVQTTLSVLAAFARFISKFAEPGRWGVTYGRLTALASIWHRAALCELAKVPDIDIEQRETLQPLKYSHADSFTNSWKADGAFFARAKPATSYGKEQGAILLPPLLSVNEFEWKKVKIKDARQKLPMLSADSELCNEIADRQLTAHASGVKWMLNIANNESHRIASRCWFFFFKKEAKLFKKKLEPSGKACHVPSLFLPSSNRKYTKAN